MRPSAAPSVEACLSAWLAGASERWRQVALNLDAEPALAPEHWTSLLSAFATELAGGAEATDAWVQACRGHQCLGRPCPSAVAAVVGRAVPLSGHAKVVSDSPDVHLSPDQCEALLRKVAMAGVHAKPRDVQILRRGLLGRYLIWATFSARTPGESPFKHLPHTTQAVRIALGLGECAETETLVLLTYESEGSGVVIDLFRPTVCDADSYHWFRPHADPDLPFGMTYPLEPNPTGLSPQPEVVHRRATAATLLLPVHLAG